MDAGGDNAAEVNPLSRVASALELLTEDELVQLNHLVVQRLRLMQQIRAHGQMVNFRIDEPVSFADSTGQLIRGIVTRHNRKSVTVLTPNGTQWRVSPHILRKG
jgi:hypothetical protein